jgi:hypothetical protein
MKAMPRFTNPPAATSAAHLHPGGVFALWSNDPPTKVLNAALAEVFATSHAHVVTFTITCRTAMQPARSTPHFTWRMTGST